MTAFMIWMSSPGGEEVRARFGSKVSFLPTGAFECPWHRRNCDEEWRYIEMTGQRYPPKPCEERLAKWQHVLRSDAIEALLAKQLPDWRPVAFFPSGRRQGFGTLVGPEWQRIAEAAREARGPLMEHAYDVSLEILQRWKEVGAAIMEAMHEDTRRARRGEVGRHWSQNFPRADAPISDWIFLHARDLYYRDMTDPFYLPDGADDTREGFESRMKTYRPFEKAYAALSSATGYTVSAVKKMLEVHRKAAIGGGDRDRRRNRK